MTTGSAERRPIEALLRHRRLIGHVLWVCALAAILILTLQPSSQTLTSTRWCVVCGSVGGVDAVLNVMLFMPLGCALAMVGVRPVRALVLMVLLTLTIETLQFLLISGRDASIGDTLTNSLGGAIGFGIGASIDVWLTPTARGARRLTVAWLAAWILIQCVASYAFTPAPTSIRYYGQIKRSLNGRPAYRGDVPLAMIDGVPIPNTSYDVAGTPLPALANRDGAVVRVDIVPRDGARRLVPIVRVVDHAFDEILLVAQVGRHLVFGIRNGGVALRLRPTYALLRDVFPRASPEAGHDTIHVEARYAARAIRLSATVGSSHREVIVPTSPVRAWRMITPSTAYADNDLQDHVITVCWIIVLLAPIGYWHAHARDRGAARALVVLGVFAGLIGVPALFGVALPSALEFGGALLALALGTLAARVAFKA